MMRHTPAPKPDEFPREFVRFRLPLAELLEEAKIEVCLVNPRHLKNVPRRETDVMMDSCKACPSR
jgi:hypothetical protein